MKNYKSVCEDCACLVLKNGVWCCDELFGQSCEDVDECPEGIEETEIAILEQKAKENKIDHGVNKIGEKTKKPRTVKISDEKIELFNTILQNLDRCEGVTRENIQVLKENKLISVQIGDKTFKIDIIQQRK